MNTTFEPEPNPHRQILAPFDDLFVWAFPVAWRNSIAAQVFLGERKNIERANDLKGSMRNVLRKPVSQFAPFLTLVESDECKSFDFVRVDWNGMSVAARWARIPSEGPIRRNPTMNTARVQEQGVLFDKLERVIGEVPLYTYAYTVERDYTLSGIPRGYMASIKLCRELYDDTEIIATLATFPEPIEAEAVQIDDELVASRIRERDVEAQEVRSLIRSIRRKLA